MSRSNRSLTRLLRPRSVAIVGASSTPGALGESVLRNLEQANFQGDLHLVNPKRSEIRSRACVPSIDDLPEGIDCAVLAIPRAAVLDAITACARRRFGSAILFAAGYAESGAEGKAEQERLAEIARSSGMVLEGPNCLGMVNGLDGIPLTFVLTPVNGLPPGKGLAIVSQSGAMAAVLGVSLRKYDLPITYSISTGNEAATGVEDYVEYLIDCEETHVITMIVELFRNPRRFLKLAERARARGKRIVLLHPGRGAAARESAATHTGALAGDYDLMRVKVTHAGVVVVESLEELIDVSQLLIRCPMVPQGGAAVLTESGAFKALALDQCEQIGLALPALSPETAHKLRQALPPFIPPSNPLDITAQGLADPDLYRRTLPPILQDPNFGSLVLSIILTDEATTALKFPPILAALHEVRSEKPILFAALDEGAPTPAPYLAELTALGVPFYPSPERAFRALARQTQSETEFARPRSLHPLPHNQLALPPGALPEYRGKEALAAAGIPIPPGALARTIDEAQQIAAKIGFPVVLKAQATGLPHKTEAGGVVLDIADASQLSDAWTALHDNIARVRPGLTLDGILVERMARKGAELIVGARNDPDWGPIVLAGFGGVLAEALHDVRLLPPDLTADAIVDGLLKLKGAAILRGFRGSPALDVRAAADIVRRIAGLIASTPGIREIDVNPVVVYPEGAVALDALIVVI